MTEYTLGLLNIDPKITVSVFTKGDPIYEMKAANRRFASQGARQISLVPRRGGKGWKVKEN